MPIVLFLLIAALLPAPAAGGTKPAPEIREHLLDEPVFGGRAYLLEAGRGKPATVLLVHGLGDLASDTWKGVIPELAADYHVLAVDLPGFGRSEKRNALYTPQRYAAFLRWIVDRHGSGPLTVVGHSLGGAVALRYAADYPNSLQRLVLVDVAGILHRTVFTRELLQPNLRDLFQLPEGAFDRIDDWIGGVLVRLPQPLLDIDQILSNEALRERILAGDPARIAALALVQEDFSRLLGEVRTPAFILWGAEDRVTSLRTGILLRSVLPAARLQVIPAAGHMPMTDQPLLFRQALRSALVDPAPTPAAPPAPVSAPEGICRNESGRTFSGPYSRLEITGCTDVRLTDVTAAELVIVRSRVTIEGGRIRGGGTALRVADSVVTATGLRAEGDVALEAAGSRLDLAGVTLIGRSAAARGERPSTLLFSVSRAESPHFQGFLHGVRQLGPEKPL